MAQTWTLAGGQCSSRSGMVGKARISFSASSSKYVRVSLRKRSMGASSYRPKLVIALSSMLSLVAARLVLRPVR